MSGKAIVAGRSIGGLFAALALLRKGWDVTVHERTGVELSGRGAGIVTHPELIAALDAVGAPTDDLGVAVEERVAFDLAGKVVHRIAYPQVVTSWDRIHGLLRALMPEGSYRLGQSVAGYTQTADEVTLHLAQMAQDRVAFPQGQAVLLPDRDTAQGGHRPEFRRVRAPMAAARVDAVMGKPDLCKRPHHLLHIGRTGPPPEDWCHLMACGLIGDPAPRAGAAAAR